MEINLCLDTPKKSWIYLCVCGLLTKNKERIKKFKETGDTKYIYRNELNKALFSAWYGLWRF